MKNTSRFALSAAVIATLAACASAPVAPPELVSASEAVQRAQSTPNVSAQAPLELKKATDSLSRANGLLAKGEPMSDVISAAYVAERQAQTAMVLANAKTAEEGLKTAEADRERARADAREREANRARAVAQTAQQSAAAAQQSAAAAQQNATAAQLGEAAAQQRAGAAENQAAAATAVAMATQQRNAQLQEQSARLQRELATMNAKQTERGMLVTLGDVLFEFGRADIKPSALDSLRKLAEFLKSNPDRSVLIEGYTDSVGSASANDVLSRRRAEAVAGALAGLGVQPSRLQSTGYGKEFPVADNSTDSNRALNRRVEVYISETSQPVRPRRG